jgi:uncharacterized protein YqeY
MTVADQIKADAVGALKAGERERAAALRLVLSELQKGAKEGPDDEQAILRRERKRRLDAAKQFREAGRSELAEQEEREAGLIEAYLPAEISDDELDRLVAAAISSTGASSPRDMGGVMKEVMAATGGTADGRRVSARVKEALNA